MKFVERQNSVGVVLVVVVHRLRVIVRVRRIVLVSRCDYLSLNSSSCEAGSTHPFSSI